MSNPVIENLSSWQPDAAAADSNLPLAGSNAGTGQAQELAGNLRLLKSEMRKIAINASWERWLGVKNLAGVANISFTFLNATQFSVNDDFTSASRLVATVGRRVKATLASTTLYGTITAATAVVATTVTVLWQSGALDATLSEVQFGPELRSVGTTSLFLQNATGVTLGAGQICSPSTTFPQAVSLVDAHATNRPVLVARQATANIALGEFLSGGLSPVDVTGAVVFGNYLISFAPANASAQDSGVSQAAGANPPSGAFGVALASSAGGTIPALLFGCTIQGNAVGLRTVSVSAPSGGHHGDIWYQVNVGVWINDFGVWFKCAP